MKHDIPTQNPPQGGCEVAKLALCSEDVKTAALPPYEVPLPGIGRAKGCVSGRTGKFVQSQNTPLFLKRGEGSGERRKLRCRRSAFSREKKFFSFPRLPSTLIGNSAYSKSSPGHVLFYFSARCRKTKMNFVPDVPGFFFCVQGLHFSNIVL